MHIQAVTAGPAVGLSLTQGVVTKLPASKAWCVAAPDALAALNVAAGSLVLVGLIQTSSAGPCTPARPGTLTSAFAPGSLPDLHAPDTLLSSLWQRHTTLHGVDVDMRATGQHSHTLPPASGLGSFLQGGVDMTTQAQHDAMQQAPVPGSSVSGLQLTTGSPGAGPVCAAGELFVVSPVWPSSKVARGQVVVSQALRDLLAGPPPGTVLALIPWPTQPLTLAAAAAAGQPATQDAVLQGPLATLPRAPPQECSQVVLRLCYHAVRCRPVSVSSGLGAQSAPSAVMSGVAGSPQVAGPSRQGSALPATPQGRAAASPLSSSGAVTPAGAGAAVGAGATTPSRQTPAAAARAAGSSSSKLGDWALQLLGPTSSGAAAPGTASDGRQAASDVQGEGGAAAAAGGELSDSQRQLLGLAAQGRLAGQVLLQGNLVSLPLLGYTLLCQVEALHCGAALLPAGLVSSSSTSVLLLLPGEETGQVGSTAAGAVQQGVASWPMQGATAQSQVVSESLPQQPVRAGAGQQRPLRELVALARQAAEEDAGEGGATQAAADAAERAVRTGWSASGLTYASLGGVNHLVGPLRELVSLPLAAPDLFRALRVRPPRGVLLHGPPGSGKTVLARAAAGDAGAVLMVVNGPDIMSEWMGESEAGLKGVFAAARKLAPAIVFVDEIDAIAPARGGAEGGAASALTGAGGGSEASSRLVTALLTAMDGPAGMGPGDGVVVVGATNRPSALDPALRRPGRLERELEVGPPPPEARRQMLDTRLRGVSHSLSDDEVTRVAEAAHGFVAADVAALVNEAALVALRRAVQQVAAARGRGAAATRGRDNTDTVPPDNGGGGAVGPGAGNSQAAVQVTWSDVQYAQARVKPSALREVAVEVPHVRWEDVGGLAHVKQRLQEAVVWPFKAPLTLTRLGAVPPRGVLLFGPPGCSKTLLAKAVAAEARLNFLSIKGGELFSKYVGESEKAIAALFARARACAPTIIFFDEIDTLAAARGNNTTGVSGRVMAQLLSEMDGLQQRVGVVVMAATNRPDCMDPALLRPGRFDRLVFVPPPDVQSRYEILQVHVRKTPLAEDVQLMQVAESCVGYSGADLSALVREAALAALEEDINTTQVCGRHFQSAQQLVLPSATPTPHMQQVYRQFDGLRAAPSFGLAAG